MENSGDRMPPRAPEAPPCPPDRPGRLRSFCERHRFSVRAVKRLLLIAAILLIAAAVLTVRGTFFIGSRTSTLGLKDIGELVTQAAYTTNVTKLENSAQVFGMKVPGTTASYVFSYDVTVKAGLDFADIELAVDEGGKTVTVMLPEAKVLSCELDQDSLQIWDADKNIFNPLRVTYFNEAQADMKATAQQTAIDNGLLDNARANAEVLIRGFLAGTYSMDTYTYIFK